MQNSRIIDSQWIEFDTLPEGGVMIKFMGGK